MTEKSDTEITGKRAEMKALIKSLEKVNPHIALNIFTSAHNVNLDTVIAYRRHGEKHSFLDEYEDGINDSEQE
jgi:ribonuclease HI